MKIRMTPSPLCRKGKKTSNKDWRSPQDPDAKITKMKDGRTHLAHKAEHGVDLETGAILSVTVQDASAGDSATLPETLTTAAEQVDVQRQLVDASSPPVSGRWSWTGAMTALGDGSVYRGPVYSQPQAPQGHRIQLHCPQIEKSAELRSCLQR